MIGLISCSAQKLDRPAPARELYCSPLFKKSIAYAEPRCSTTYVLSALHGLVALDQHELAEQLGRRLYALVEQQSERARCAALEIARDHLRAQIEVQDATEEEAGLAGGARQCVLAASSPAGRAVPGAPGATGGSDRGDRDGDCPGAPGTPRRRAQVRCTVCNELGHNARRHRRAADLSEASPGVQEEARGQAQGITVEQVDEVIDRLQRAKADVVAGKERGDG